MPNPRNTTNLTVSEETYNRLKNIKELKGWTFNQIIEKLCELELQYNYIELVEDYELYYQDKIYPFRVTFKKENMIIEYYDGLKFTKRISNWGLPSKIINKFYEFLNEECSRCVLLHIPIGLMFEEFDIYKIT